MEIQQKILQFRKEKQLAGKCIATLVYRVNKDEAIEIAKFLSGKYHFLCREFSSPDPDFCIQMARDGIFKPLHELIIHMDTMFGVEIHPDWQEYTNKNMYY